MSAITDKDLDEFAMLAEEVRGQIKQLYLDIEMNLGELSQASNKTELKQDIVADLKLLDERQELFKQEVQRLLARVK